MSKTLPLATQPRPGTYPLTHGTRGILGCLLCLPQMRQHSDSFEELDDGTWTKSVWIRPSLEDAEQHLQNQRFESGQASLCGTTLAQLSSMGVAVSLHFHLLRELGFFFLIATFITLPSMLMNKAGERVTDESQDPLGFAVLSLGNLGPLETSQVDADSLASSVQVGLNTSAGGVNGTRYTITMPFGETLTLSEASGWQAWLDVMSVLLFLITCLIWVRRIRKVRDQVDSNNVTAADYSVLVRGLPRDATEHSVRQHFDRLYNLRQRDWVYPSSCWRCYIGRKTKYRRQFIGPARAAHLYALRMQLTAELKHRGQNKGARTMRIPSIPMHSALLAIARKDADAAQKLHQRAAVLAASGVAPSSLPKVGWEDWETKPTLDASNTADPEYLRSWCAEVTIIKSNGNLLRKYQQLRHLRSELRQVRAFAKRYDPRSPEADARKYAKYIEKHNVLEAKLQQFDLKNAGKWSDDCVGAFVVFNNEESFRRVLQDYHLSRTWLCRRCCQQPTLLYHRQFPLEVRRAPEPSDVLFDNLDTSAAEKCARRSGINLFMLLLLALSFVAIVIAQEQKEEFAKRVPDLTVCDLEAPAAAFGSYDNAASARLARRTDLDATCGDGHVWMQWVDGHGSPAPDQVYNTSLIASQGCSHVCRPTSGDLQCNGLSGRRSWYASVVPACYCVQALNEAVAAHGLFSGAAAVLNSERLCEEYTQNFVISQTLIAVAAVSIVLVNTFLKAFLKLVTRWERHDSVSDEKSAMAVKLFFALFLNTGLLTLLVYARVPQLKGKLPIPLFNGEYDTFAWQWYTQAGTALCLTMLINIAAVHAWPLLQWMLVLPCKRRILAGGKVTQRHLNQLYSAPHFEVETRVPYVLNTVSVSLLYSAGMPVLLPLAAAALAATYLIDKLLLLRMYRRPALLDESMALMAARILPFVAGMHLLSAVYMFGSDDVLEPQPVLLPGGAAGAYNSFVAGTARWDVLGLGRRVVRHNVWPVFFLLVLLILAGACYLLLAKTAGLAAILLIRRVLNIMTCGRYCGGRLRSVGVETNHNPRFTGEFYVKLEGKKNLLTADEVADGYAIVDDPRRGKRAEQRVRYFTDAGYVNGKYHRQWEPMLTWEHIAEYGVPSYDLAASEYREVVLAIEAGRLNAANLNKLLRERRDSVQRRRRLSLQLRGAAAAVLAVATGNKSSARLAATGAAAPSPMHLLRSLSSHLDLRDTTPHPVPTFGDMATPQPLRGAARNFQPTPKHSSRADASPSARSGMPGFSPSVRRGRGGIHMPVGFTPRSSAAGTAWGATAAATNAASGSGGGAGAARTLRRANSAHNLAPFGSTTNMLSDARLLEQDMDSDTEVDMLSGMSHAEQPTSSEAGRVKYVRPSQVVPFADSQPDVRAVQRPGSRASGHEAIAMFDPVRTPAVPAAPSHAIL